MVHVGGLLRTSDLPLPLLYAKLGLVSPLEQLSVSEGKDKTNADALTVGWLQVPTSFLDILHLLSVLCYNELHYACNYLLVCFRVSRNLSLCACTTLTWLV